MRTQACSTFTRCVLAGVALTLATPVLAQDVLSARPPEGELEKDSPSVAAPAAKPPTFDLETLVAQLDSPALTDRQKAGDSLHAQSLVVLMGLLTRDSLTLEQRTRLELTARSKFMQGPRAALGVRWNANDPGGATILSTEPAFDCSKVLQAGDIIVRIGDVDIAAVGSLPPAILSYSPDDRVEIRFLRNDKKCVGTVIMGDFRTLANQRLPNQVDFNLATAWLLYRDRTLKGSTRDEAPIAIRFDEHALLAVDTVSTRSRFEDMRMSMPPNGIRVNINMDRAGQDDKSRPTRITSGGDTPLSIAPPPRFFTPLRGDVSEQIRARVAMMERDLESIDSDIATSKALFENAATDDERDLHRNNLKSMSDKRNLIQQQLDGLRQQINGRRK
ncbi:MAG: PDZ domain-containing protein [Phycisphaerales bacterium]|nr:MAG: PDZ domain-containing protein [Phycisphaerales bacterium]